MNEKMFWLALLMGLSGQEIIMSKFLWGEKEIILAGGQYTGLLESWISGDTDKDKRLSLEEFLKYLEQKQA